MRPRTTIPEHDFLIASSITYYNMFQNAYFGAQINIPIIIRKKNLESYKLCFKEHIMNGNKTLE